MAAFPAGYYPERSLVIVHENNVELDQYESGAPRLRVMGTDEFVVMNVELKYLTLTEKNTLKAWLVTNKAATVTWTIDSIDYSGVILNSHTEVMTSRSNLYRMTFTYRAKEV